MRTMWPWHRLAKRDGHNLGLHCEQRGIFKADGLAWTWGVCLFSNDSNVIPAHGCHQVAVFQLAGHRAQASRNP
jgi:hypothetical protein